MTSQYGEHEFILNHFLGRPGRFLDVGAHDGRIFSNTWPLTEAGWDGVLLEPSPSVFPYLAKHYEGRAHRTLQAALVPVDVGGSVTFYDCGGDCYSTVSTAHRDKITTHPWAETKVPALTWDALLSGHPGPYDFVNIDVEGINAELLRTLPVERLNTEMYCIELDPAEEVKRLVYERLANYRPTIIGGNILAVRI